MRPKQCGTQGTRRAFTRLDLVVVLATLALVAAVTRPMWGSSGMSKSLLCMDNLRRLQSAWLLYATEMQGVMPGNYHGNFVPGTNALERPWATGWLDWGTRADNTNTLYLTEARYASLAGYLDRDLTVYRCPADEYLSGAQAAQRWPARVRSYSLNCFLGAGNQDSGPNNLRYTFYRKLSEFRRLTPQQAFVFIEEHPDSINDPLFWAPSNERTLPDFPASLHEGMCWLTYADGHLEPRRWSNPAIKAAVRFANYNSISVPPGDPDLVWLLEHASELLR